MSRLHDMGGRFGDGPVRPDTPKAPVFAAEWHGRALAVTLACGALGQWNLDTSRHAREKLSPQDYTRFTYYEIWLAALADLLVQKGVLSEDDLAGQGSDAPHPLAEKCLHADAVAGVLARGGPATREGGPSPAFVEGQTVRTRHPGGNRLVNGGHTRLPTYATGAQGRILRLHGTHVLPDSSAHGLGEAPEPLYAVAFPAGELWSHPEHPEDEVVLDLWQSYLDPV
ncbi:nitrile hydratase subunit beta [Phaeobacter sp. QD34_3]|uniref:nitrile hydratase subunit beta n=1 Tax=unclassified Phaeobacter TaxID=2621772 RepID=UPI00237F0E38|nr:MULTISPECIES: nitrile hydratase subunit beta [unclassified Phaeobacter]MDE4131832.1 nitrile hydratase subunit beta [Phaeobacter sp. QD34_3]MDE4135470.1 nitrile hydratase subunit beta [Phaeobacter sp. QD34_24]MDE4173459.1 nitrile hydratase subunit beta [Phaeobacter sp. PT47_59]